jgi:hypothetical protein
MLRRLMLVLLGLCACCSLVNAQTQVFKSAEGEVFNNATLGFSIVFPKGWTTGQGKDDSSLTMVCPRDGANDAFQEVLSISWSTVQYDELTDEAFQAMVDAAKTQITGYTVVSTFAGTLADTPAKAVVFTSTLPEDPTKQRKAIQFFLVKKKVLYGIMGMTTLEDYDKYKTVFQTCAKSLLFSQRKPPPPPAPVRTTWKDEGFSIMGPAGWAAKEAAWPKFPGKVVSFTRTTVMANDPVNEMLFVYTDPLKAPQTLEKYFADQLALLNKSMPLYKEITTGNMTVNERKGKFVLYAGKANGINVGMLRCVLMDTNRVFVLTCMSTVDGFAKYRDTFEKTITSFEVLK